MLPNNLKFSNPRIQRTLSLNDGQQQSQSNSCGDLVSGTEVVVLSEQNHSNRASEPVT